MPSPKPFSKVDQYILREFSFPFIGSLLFLSFILLMFQALRLADSFIVHGAPASILGKLMSLMLASFLPISLPIAFLLSLLIAFQRLSSDSEIIAMKATGMSLSRLARTPWLLAISVGCLSLALHLTLIPKVDRAIKETIIQLSNTKAVAAIQEGTFTSGFFDLLIFAEKVNPQSNRLEKVFIYDERNPKSPNSIVAKRGETIPVQADNVLETSLALRLQNGSIINVQEQSEASIRKLDFDDYQIFLNVDAGKGDAAVKASHLPYRALLDRLNATVDHQDRRNLRAELWRRFATGAAPFVFVLLGLGLGITRNRTQRAGPLLMALFCIVPYWMLQALGTKLATSGYLPPVLAMSLPNIVLGTVGYLKFRESSQ